MMKFTFTEKRMDATPAMKEYAEKKISKIQKYFKSDSEAFVTFSTERGRYIAEVTVKNNGMYYRVKEVTSDMCASIDSAVAAIERQIRKNKTKLEKRIRTDAFEREIHIIPRRTRRRIQDRSQQALQHRPHVRRRSHPADEPAGPQLLRIQERQRRRHLLRCLHPQRRRLRLDHGLQGLTRHKIYLIPHHTVGDFQFVRTLCASLY